MSWRGFGRQGDRDGYRERRGACRYPAAEGGEAWLGWWGEGEFRASPARLLNVSLGGSLVLADALPESGRAVFIGLGGESWVESDLIAATSRGRSRYEARLAFPEACPYDFFKAVVFGRHALDGPRPACT